MRQAVCCGSINSAAIAANHEMHAKVGMWFSQIETTRADLGDLNRSAANSPFALHIDR